jgi:phosphoesterase RecJ-like protein
LVIPLSVSDEEPITGPTPPIGEEDWQRACDLVARARRILLVSHKKPDGDAIGSLLGLGHALESAGKSVTMACADPPANALAQLPGAERIVTDLSPHSSSNGALPWDLIISADASGLDRLGTVYEANRQVFAALPVIDLDHHITNDRFGAANLVDPAAAAATEVATLFLQRLGIRPNVPSATGLMFGLLTDTLSFQTEVTSSRTFEVAAYLLECGAPLSALATGFRRRPLGSALVWSKAMGSLQFAAGGRIAWFEVPRSIVESSGPGADTSGLSGFAGSILGVDVGMVIEEGADGHVYVGLRSQTIDVAQLAAQFGGGGHQRAAGCQFTPPATIAGARAALLAAIEAALERGT